MHETPENRHTNHAKPRPKRLRSFTRSPVAPLKSARKDARSFDKIDLRSKSAKATS